MVVAHGITLRNILKPVTVVEKDLLLTMQAEQEKPLKALLPSGASALGHGTELGLSLGVRCTEVTAAPVRRAV